MITLEDYLNQEIFVNQSLGAIHNSVDEEKLNTLNAFFQEHKNKYDYSTIFTFFYGDKASQTLNYPLHNIHEVNGFDYARFLANKL